MKIVRFSLFVGTLSFAVWSLAVSAANADAEQVWEATGFMGPESAVHDAGRDLLYISNVNGGPVEKDGNGFISKLGLDGQMLEAQWVTGLDAPKGMALHGDKLYVSDIDKLIEIDVTSGAIVGTYPAADSKFLNDVAADQDGQIYVSDMQDDAIYQLKDGSFGLWLKDEALEAPNGLLVEGDQLLIAAWGKMTDGFSTETPGHLKTISLDSKSIKSLGSGTPVGNLDGLEADGKGSYLVTDWMVGGLYHIGTSGKSDLLLDLGQGSADLEFIADKGLAIIPMMNDGKVTAFQIE